MAVLRLTQQNLKSIKQSLRRELPGIGSGRLTEGIAAAAGFRTHASLLAAMESTGSDPIVRLDEALLSARLAELGDDAPIGSMSSIVRNRGELPDPCWREASEKSREQLKDW